MKFKILIISIAAITLFSCENKNIVDQKMDISPNGWAYADSLKVNFDIRDTLKIYNIYLSVVHQNSFPFQNLYTKIATQFPEGERIEQPLSLELTEASGKPIGKKSGDNVTTDILAREGAFFNKSGRYQITIAQHMRQDSLNGIVQIRYRIEETGETRDPNAKKKK